jgi:phospholipase/carboxylesterase
MNRIESATEILSLPTAIPSIPPSLSGRTLERIRLHGADATPHATFAPMHYEPGYAYPLLVWLHDALGDEREVRQIVPQISIRNFVAIAPRGTCAARCGRNAYGWSQAADTVELAESRILDCVEIASRRFNIHQERIFLVGAGCGGTMALRTAWNYPGRFAGVATLGGPMPADDRPMRNVNALRRLPCFISSGRTSRDYPEADVCRDLRLLHSAGCTVALRQYPCGDDLTTSMLEDLNRWMMEIVCQPPA